MSGFWPDGRAARPAHRLLAAMMDACAESVTFDPISDEDGVIGWLARSRDGAGPRLVLLPRAGDEEES